MVLMTRWCWRWKWCNDKLHCSKENCDNNSGDDDGGGGGGCNDDNQYHQMLWQDDAEDDEMTVQYGLTQSPKRHLVLMTAAYCVNSCVGMDFVCWNKRFSVWNRFLVAFSSEYRNSEQWLTYFLGINCYDNSLFACFFLFNWWNSLSHCSFVSIS